MNTLSDKAFIFKTEHAARKLPQDDSFVNSRLLFLQSDGLLLDLLITLETLLYIRNHTVCACMM